MSQRALARRMARLIQIARHSRATGVPGAELLAAARVPTRRQVLGALPVIGALPLVGCPKSTGFKSNPGGARVVVIGGGLAGLNAVHRLEQAGVYAELYEASERVGGCVMSQTGLFSSAPDLVTELGGEFIDSTHDELLSLVEELGLNLLDREADEALDVCYFVGGARYTEAQLVDELGPIAAAVDAAWEDIEDDGERVSYADYAGARAYDLESFASFLDRAGGGAAVRAILEATYVCEYGLDLDEQSALNLIMMLDTEADGLGLYGESDERYRVEGGNARVPEGLAAIYADRLHLGRPLEALLEGPAGAYTLVFEGGEEVSADVVILTLPFTVLRELELDLPLSDVKRRCIDELGYGSNAKLLLPFSRRFWRDEGEDGEVYTDLAFQTTWDSSLLQPGEAGVLVNYTGGSAGVAIGQATAAENAAAFLTDLEKVYPGAGARFGGESSQRWWPGAEWARGSYACYKTGQYTNIGGAEAEPVGNVFFAGAHTSWDFQGYMNGGAATGAEAAAAVVDLLGHRRRHREAPRAGRRRPTAARWAAWRAGRLILR